METQHRRPRRSSRLEALAAAFRLLQKDDRSEAWALAAYAARQRNNIHASDAVCLEPSP